MKKLAEVLRSLTTAHSWEGTVEDLAIALSRSGAGTMSAAHLGIWLRRHEPTLWWDFALNMQFTRTGRSRLVHLSRRKPHNRVKAIRE